MAQAGTSGAASGAPRALWGGHECGSSVLGNLRAVKSSSVGFVLKFIAPTMVVSPQIIPSSGRKSSSFHSHFTLCFFSISPACSHVCLSCSSLGCGYIPVLQTWAWLKRRVWNPFVGPIGHGRLFFLSPAVFSPSILWVQTPPWHVFPMLIAG